MKFSDLMEHELKFQINHDEEVDIILNTFSKYGELEFYETREQIDKYFDTDNLDLQKNNYTYKYREINGIKSRINFKFPGYSHQGFFVRRELRNKYKKLIKKDVLSIDCKTNKYFYAFLDKYNIDIESIKNTLTLYTERKSYLFYDEKDIYGKKRTYGVLYFDKCKTNSLEENTELFEFEFELWNGGICEKNIILQKKINENLIERGLKPSKITKYQYFTSGITNEKRE